MTIFSLHSCTKGGCRFADVLPGACAPEEMRKLRVAVIISRRKLINARKSENIAAINITAISLDKFTTRKVPVKRVAITMQVSKAQIVQRLMAKFTRRARVERRLSS